MIKGILFDLDGVLIETRTMHFETLNAAIAAEAPEFVISLEDHLAFFNGRPTREKLAILSSNALPHRSGPGLLHHLHEAIFKRKQTATLQWINDNVKPDDKLIELFSTLTREGYKLGVVSNAVKATVTSFLKLSHLEQYVGAIVSNEDVDQPKPSPLMYLRAMDDLELPTNDTLIVEDSPVGVSAALRSLAHVLHVAGPEELTLTKVLMAIDRSRGRSRGELCVPDLNILIPMGGAGKRFAQAGYVEPKPLIPVLGRPMIQLVVESIELDCNLIYVASENHIAEHRIDEALQRIKPCTVVVERGPLRGAAYALLLAEEHIDNNNPLLIANSDQDVDWDYVRLMQQLRLKEADAAILTFKDTNPKWSFARVNDDGFVTEVAEKRPISDDATCGIYYWKRGGDFCRFARQMIEKNIRVNGEFYVCPVFNEAIEAGLKVITQQVTRMEGLGTPEDLETYLAARRR